MNGAVPPEAGAQANGSAPLDACLDEAMDLAMLIVEREAKALQYVSETLQKSPEKKERFRQALALALESTGQAHGSPSGKIIVVGIGKSGIIARKIASMLLSLGTQAIFLHPADCLHGDLGAVFPGHDVVLALSYSGQSHETVSFLDLEPVRRCVRIAMAGDPSSPLVQKADVWLDCSTAPPPHTEAPSGGVSGALAEAYPAIPAPTSSTTVMLALGDAFSIALTRAKGIEKATFKRNHPGGNLGMVFRQEKE